MFKKISKWLHDRRGYCGYEKVDHPDLYQGFFFCVHCNKIRLSKPRVRDHVLITYIE